MLEYSENFLKEAKKLAKKFKLLKSDLKLAVEDIENKEDLGVYLGYNLYKKRIVNSLIPTGNGKLIIEKRKFEIFYCSNLKLIEILKIKII